VDVRIYSVTHISASEMCSRFSRKVNEIWGVKLPDAIVMYTYLRVFGVIWCLCYGRRFHCIRRSSFCSRTFSHRTI